MYSEFKLNKKWSKCFLSIIVARLVAFGVCLSMFHDIPLAQTGICFLINMAYLITLGVVKPFVSRIVYFLTLVVEVFICLSNLMFVINAIDDMKKSLGESNREIVDVINCSCIFLVIALSIIGVIFLAILKLY
jgi:hypothetical protein